MREERLHVAAFVIISYKLNYTPAAVWLRNREPVKLLTLLSCCTVSRHFPFLPSERDSFRTWKLEIEHVFERKEDSISFEEASFLRAKILHPIIRPVNIIHPSCCSSSVLSRSTIGKTQSYPTERKYPYRLLFRRVDTHLLLKYT